MNKIFSLSLGLLLVVGTFSSCVKSEEDDIFDKSAAERLNEASSLYSARLEAQPNGWAMQLYPTYKDEAPYGNGYLVLLDFNADNSVKASMNNSLTNNLYTEDTSAWDVITDDGPVLTFNTYNKVVHAFTNPEDVASTGSADDPNDETGVGIGGDYEFIIVDAPEDASYMMLKGKKRGTYNLLTPIEEGVDYEQYLLDVKAFQSKMFPSSSPTFDVLHYGDSICKFEDASDGIPSIYPYDGDAIIETSFNPFLITKRGNDYYLRFRDSKTFGDVTVQDYKYLTDKDIFQSVDNEAYYLDGDNPARFFNQSITDDAGVWMIKDGSEMSESFATLYNNVKAGFSDVKYTLQSISFRNILGTLKLRVAYKAGKSNSTVDYLYSVTRDGDNVKFSYEGADKAAGETILEKLPALKTMIDTLAQTYAVSAGNTRFNLTTIKITSSADSNLWVVLSKN